MVIVDFHNGYLLSAVWLVVVHEYKGLSFLFVVKLAHIPRFDFVSTYHSQSQREAMHILYSGKFSYGAKFRIFRMLHPLCENKNCENLNVRNFISFACDL